MDDIKPFSIKKLGSKGNTAKMLAPDSFLLVGHYVHRRLQQFLYSLT